jgi:hypothetical protein
MLRSVPNIAGSSVDTEQRTLASGAPVGSIMPPIIASPAQVAAYGPRAAGHPLPDRGRIDGTWRPAGRVRPA